MVHLVYCDNVGKSGERVLDKIMAGKKTMVVRGAAGRKIPHSRVFEGETLYFMQKGTTAVCAKATVSKVENFIKLSDEDVERVFAERCNALALTAAQVDRWHKKCLCFVSFTGVAAITPSLEFEKQNNMDDWLIIDKIEDVLVGTSIPYDYSKTKF